MERNKLQLNMRSWPYLLGPPLSFFRTVIALFCFSRRIKENKVWVRYFMKVISLKCWALFDQNGTNDILKKLQGNESLYPSQFLYFQSLDSSLIVRKWPVICISFITLNPVWSGIFFALYIYWMLKSYICQAKTLTSLTKKSLRYLFSADLKNQITFTMGPWRMNIRNLFGPQDRPLIIQSIIEATCTKNFKILQNGPKFSKNGPISSNVV